MNDPLRIAYKKRQHFVGSHYKYAAAFDQVCDLDLVPQFPVTPNGYDGAVLVGYQDTDYARLAQSGTPYLFIANDLYGMRWNTAVAKEKECVLDASYVMTNTPDTLAWMKENYGVKDGSVVYLRPLAADLDFEPLPKLSGKNIAYAGGLVVDTPQYSYRDYRQIFTALMKAGWTVHCYPGWGHTSVAPTYAAIGCIMHDPVSEGKELYRELSQYQASFQGYAYGDQQHYINAACPNKYWLGLAAGIPTLGYNPGKNAYNIYEGKWGYIAKTLDNLPEISEKVLAMEIDPAVRAAEVIDGDLEELRDILTKGCVPRPLRVGMVGRNNICGQLSILPPEMRKRGFECEGFSRAESRFGYTPLENGDPAFLTTADIIHFEVTHENLDLWPYNRNAALVCFQHGHMGRPGDAPLSELELDKKEQVTRVVSTLNLLPYVDNDPARWMPCALDPSILSMEREKRDDGKVLIVQSPSKREGKQTEALIAAVEALQGEGYPVDLDIIEGVSHEECLRRKARADICFDRLELCHGQSGVEAMYFGIPVIAGMADETDERVRDIVGYRPYVRASEESLVDVLRSLVKSPGWRAKAGRAGAKYARAWHTPEVVAERRDVFYRSLKKPHPRPERNQLTDPVTLGREVILGSTRYPAGCAVPLALARQMYRTGLLTDARLA